MILSYFKHFCKSFTPVSLVIFTKNPTKYSSDKDLTSIKVRINFNYNLLFVYFKVVANL